MRECDSNESTKHTGTDVIWRCTRSGGDFLCTWT